MKYFYTSVFRPVSQISLTYQLLLIVFINIRLNFSYTVITDKDANGMLYETYIDRQLQNWVDLGLISERAVNEALILPEKLKGLYETLKFYPEVMNRRLQIGGTKPPLVSDSSSAVEKRSLFDFGLAQPACPFKTQWQRLYTAKDMNNTTVEVFQPTDDSNRYQWFYTVSCDFERLNREAAEQNLETTRFCRGINRQRFISVCVPRKSYVMALVRKSRDFSYDWDYIQVDTSCNCAVTPLPHI